MLIAPNSRNEIDKLATKLAKTTKASAVLFAEIFAASPRLMSLRAIGKTGQLDRLVACEAWIEAAMEFAAIEVPTWSIQRLCRDDREWLCSLTRFPDLPDWLDDSAEGRHPVMALAILSAVLDSWAHAVASSPVFSRQVVGLSSDCADYR